ncbi:hypothetical protein VIGAN_04240000, partial [Vigna angularis var. angularis]
WGFQGKGKIIGGESYVMFFILLQFCFGDNIDVYLTCYFLWIEWFCCIAFCLIMLLSFWQRWIEIPRLYYKVN